MANIFYAGRVAFDTGILVFIVYMVGVFVTEYVGSFTELPPETTRMQRVWYTCYHSGTILWSKVLALSAVAVSQLDPLCDFLGLDQTKAFINNWVSDPHTLGMIVFGISAITFWVRMNKSSTDPVKK